MTDFAWTYVKEIPNTKLLVSLIHHHSSSANMAIYDISKQGKVHEIYSLGEISGCILTFSLSLNNNLFL